MSDDVCRHCLGVDPLTWPDGERYPTAPDRPGDRDQQQAAALMGYEHSGYCAARPSGMACFCSVRPKVDATAAALAAARAEEAARWRAKIEALAEEMDADGDDYVADYGNRIRAVLDAS